MNILVVTRSSWDKNNNIGNTMNSIFESIEEAVIDNIYFRSDIPNNNVCRSVYQISEQGIIKNIFNRKPVGSVINASVQTISAGRKEEKLYSTAKKMNLYFPWFIREFFWWMGNWKNKKLDEYLDSISPNIIFMPVFGCWYPHRVLAYITKKTKAKVILYHADDNYTLKQFRFSPFYWLYRLNLRKWIKKSIRISDLNFCISDEQVKEYEKALKIPCKLLTKYAIFDEKSKKVKKVSEAIKMIYTGNISSGRWKSLALVIKAIASINKDKKKVMMDIYTATPITAKMKKALCICEECKIKGRVDSTKIPEIQESADILIHAESFSIKDKCEVRLSFSTKIVDYLTRARCILAIGPSDVASIAYFKNSGAAFVIDDKKKVRVMIEELVNDESKIQNYANAAWNHGKLKHNIDQKDLFIKELFQL